MTSLFSSTRNTRAVLPDSFKYIRSDVPCELTDEEVQWLLDNNVRTIIDLRTDEERADRPCCLSRNQSFEYLEMPITGGNEVPATVEDVPFSYVTMLDSQMKRVIDVLLGSGYNCLYFCNAGKDRTGVVTAVLLDRLGYDKEFIIEDYLKSNDYLKEYLEQYVKEHPEVDIDVITPRRENIEKIYKFLKSIQ